ncbi:dephospho-CoA kinase [bacterium]|nr:dephospho-CoA kinase [bacterium]
MIKVAITGNIASGKSSVQKIFEDNGFKVFDTDKIAHKLLDDNEKRIIKTFSDFDITEDGKISRRKLGRLVFNDENLRKELENILHPEIREEILKRFRENENEEFVFVGIPLLYEAKMEDLFDKVVVVCTDENIRIKRISDRDNLSKDDALKRINSQMPQDEKVKLADFVIENNSDLKTLEKNVYEILNRIK